LIVLVIPVEALIAALVILGTLERLVVPLLTLLVTLFPTGTSKITFLEHCSPLVVRSIPYPVPYPN